MAECAYCGHDVEQNMDKCPHCGQDEPAPEHEEPAKKSAFALRYSSCCQTRLNIVMILFGMAAFTYYLLAYWLPAGASMLQIASLIIPGLFFGAVIGVYLAALLAFLFASISSGENISSNRA